MKCKLCNHEVVLIPSAAERVKQYGGKAEDYIKLFPVHTRCALKKNADEVADLMRRKSS